MNGHASALMVSLRNGFQQKACAADRAVTSFRNPNQWLSQHSLLANKALGTGRLVLAHRATCASGLAEVVTALPPAVTNDTASDLNVDAFDRIAGDLPSTVRTVRNNYTAQ